MITAQKEVNDLRKGIDSSVDVNLSIALRLKSIIDEMPIRCLGPTPNDPWLRRFTSEN